MQLLFIFDSLWLNVFLIFLLIWLLVSILVYQRNSAFMKNLHQWLILPAFMIFGEQKTATNQAKSNAEIERFNAYLEESAVLQKLQIALKKRAGVDLQQLKQLRDEVQQMAENYQHQSHYVTELSKKISQPSSSVDPATVPSSPTPLTERQHFISSEELETRFTEFYTVLKQIQTDTNEKLAALKTEQAEVESQFEAEVDALSTAIGNISTAHDARPALQELNKKIGTLELYVQEVQQEWQQHKLAAKTKANSATTAATAAQFIRTGLDKNTNPKQKENFEGVKYNKDKIVEKSKVQPTPTPAQAPAIDITADDNFTNYQGKMLFAAPPTDEIFIADQLVSKFVAKVTPYAIKISTRDPQMAFYHLVTHAETVDYARQQPSEMIESAMFVMGKGELETAKRITMKAGELELIDGKWEIVKRAVLRFE